MKYKNIFLAFCAVALTLGSCEAVLRLLGYKPGTFKKPGGFELVDSLILYKNYTTDEAGIYKFSPWVSDSVPLYFDFKREGVTNSNIADSLYPVDDLNYTYANFYSLAHPGASGALLWKIRNWFEKESDTSEFASAYQRALICKADTADDWAEAIVGYVQHPFNQEGFRSIAFKTYNSKRKKVLLLGDSFAYGMSAQPIYNSFADILLARGYIVYNTGIPGVDPAQYAAVAEKYIPRLKPDIVIVCFYEGNDYMPFVREPSQSKPIEHITNAGFFDSAPLGTYLNPYQAYTYYKSLISIPDQATNQFNNFCAHSDLGGLLWSVLYKMKKVEHKAAKLADSIEYNYRPDIAYTAGKMRLIDSICRVQGAAVKVVVIPTVNNDLNRGRQYLSIDKKQAGELMGKMEYYTPGNLTAESDFPKNGIHFNNKGSTKFANLLDSLLSR